MKKVFFKILALFFIIFLLLSCFMVFALDYDDFQPTLTQEPELIDKASKIFTYVNIIGVIISIMVIVIIGIKYMLGSVDEKAEYKTTAITYLIGAFLLFSATTVPNIIYNFSDDIVMVTVDESKLIFCPHCGKPKNYGRKVLNNEAVRCDYCHYIGGGWLSERP